jgi:hypothetical protein
MFRINRSLKAICLITYLHWLKRAEKHAPGTAELAEFPPINKKLLALTLTCSLSQTGDTIEFRVTNRYADVTPRR